VRARAARRPAGRGGSAAQGARRARSPSLSFFHSASLCISIYLCPSLLSISLPPSLPPARHVTSERVPRRPPFEHFSRRQADALVQLERADDALPPLRAQARAPRGAPPRCSTFSSAFVNFQLKDRCPRRRTRSHSHTHKDTEKLFFTLSHTHTCSLTHTRRAGAGGHSAAAARGRGDGGAAAGRRRWRFAARAVGERDETCPLSTEGWTRRVHFVREGGGGGRERGRCVRRVGRGPHGAAGARRQPLHPGPPPPPPPVLIRHASSHPPY
jgi:hypothetical protein